MTVRAGEFWIADIPFTNAVASKKRPVLVLWLDGLDAVVVVVTSSGPRSSTDVAVSEWKTAGLRVPSTVRLSRLDCIEQSLLIHRLGALASADAQKIKTVWDLSIKPQF